jgi:hypothetical protein
VTKIREYFCFFGFFLCILGLSLGYIYIFGNPRVSYDGWQYLSSAKAIVTDTLPENYFWVRQPGYSLFIAFSSLISQSLWFVFGAQVFIFTLVYTLFVYECTRHLAKPSLREYFFLAFINFVFILAFVGGYFIILTPQALTGAYLLLLTTGLLRVWRIFNSVEIVKKFECKIAEVVFMYLFFPIMCLIGFCLSTFIGVLPIVCLLMLLVMAAHKHLKSADCRKSKIVSTFSIWIPPIFLSVLMLLSVFFLWQNFLMQAQNDVNFNKANLQDPFWAGGISSYLENIKLDPALLHYIPASFLALLMLIPNQGWNGITLERMLNNHSQNGDIGFGLFSSNYGQCVSIPPEVLTVNNTFISDFLWRDTCAFMDFDLPLVIFYLIFAIWITLSCVWIWSLFRRMDDFTFIASLPVLLFLGTYSIFGGGIDRYGSSSYPIIAFLSILTLYNKKFIDQRANTHINASTVSNGAAL